MKPAVGLPVVLVLIALLCGCEICQGPFDYCNPVIGPSGSLNCDWGARSGSAFHPFHDEPMVGASAPAPRAVPGATGGQYQPTEVAPAETQPTGALVPEDFPELENEAVLQ